MGITDKEFLPHTGIDQILMDKADGFSSLEADVSQMDNRGIVEGVFAALREIRI